MNKRHAVLKSYVLFAFLAETGKSKGDYPVSELLPSIYYFKCPLCKFSNINTSNINQAKCDCPMQSRWTSITGKLHEMCYLKFTDYSIWQSRHLDNEIGRAIRRVYAGNVAKSLWKLYKELEDK